MAKKEFTYRGKTIEDLKKMTLQEFAELVPARERRKIKRGFTDAEKKFLKVIQKNPKNIETHCRDMIVLPQMVGMMIKIHNGKEFIQIMIDPEMIAHRLGELVLTRKNVAHGAAGVGATRSSSAISVR